MVYAHCIGEAFISKNSISPLVTNDLYHYSNASSALSKVLPLPTHYFFLFLPTHFFPCLFSK
jgi:hypothetical protein